MIDSVLKTDLQSYPADNFAWRIYPYGFETEVDTALPTIVLLHGWGMTQQVWQRLVPYLQSQCNVMSIDLPGFGDSAGMNSAADIDHMIETLIPVLPPRAVYVGWSMGGNIALEIAQRYSGRVDAVVAVSSNPSFVARDNWPGMSCQVFENFQKGLAQSVTKTLNRFALLQVQGEQLQRQTLVELKAGLSLQSDSKNLIQSLQWLGEFDQRTMLENLAVPCMFLLAEHDQLVPVSLADQLPDNVSVRVQPGSAHAPFIAMPEKVAREILGFAAQQNLFRHQRGNLDKQLVAGSFGRSAKTYDQAARLQRDVADRLLEPLPDRFQGVVADLGCGTGYCIAKLAQRNYPTPVAIDIAEPMLRYARDEKGLAAIYLAGDAESIPLADNSIDLIVSSLAVQWCEQLPLLFAEIERVLKPNGRCYISTFGRETLVELRSAWQQVDDYSHVNRFYSAEVLERVARQQNLLVESLETRKYRLRYNNFLDLARELKAIGAHNINQGRPKGLMGRARLKALELAFQDYRDAQGWLPASYEVIFACYQKPLSKAN